jgi:hypothetical protein
VSKLYRQKLETLYRRKVALDDAIASLERYGRSRTKIRPRSSGASRNCLTQKIAS